MFPCYWFCQFVFILERSFDQLSIEIYINVSLWRIQRWQRYHWYSSEKCCLSSILRCCTALYKKETLLTLHIVLYPHWRATLLNQVKKKSEIEKMKEWRWNQNHPFIPRYYFLCSLLEKVYENIACDNFVIQMQSHWN